MKITKQQLFKRQTTLSEIGEEGQQRLQNAKVLIVGCGGLGSPVAVYLASSGVGELHLVDFDTVDITNLHRQVFYSLDDVGKPKAEVLTNFIKQRAPFTKVSYTNSPINKENVLKLISDYDIVVDGTDSLPTKYLVNDACVLTNKPLVYGSLYKFDGYVATFNALQKDGTRSTNLRDAFPTMATDIPNCSATGTLNAIVGLIATQQVNEVLKLITEVGKPLTNELLIYNSLQNSQLKMKLKPTISKNEIQQIFEKETYFDVGCEVQNPEWLISPEELKNQLHQVEIICVLENLQLPFSNYKTIPTKNLLNSGFHPKENTTYVMVCAQGITSYQATKLLKEKYKTLKVYSLIGGVTGFLNS
ncbi:HesA/MoeB/ThiF family protein [Tenacibaculum sp. IB213877]|uniref:HesA/MoeB/ThiF family protein n=1 Tax=Tenacibaculum sp. IB213877 TaxID=3097351 RepID=UPI002A59A854|nr:HesA/MoeB/ThiF family protein [Tenacibaculum sp. IB213877]MDY0780378.1 HesA/MoeB/ThiF family protein [Tenacibaculum sp. IB213877]